jgi:hypothetical protein
MRAGGQGDVDAVVHEEELPGQLARSEESSSEGEEVAPSEILLAQVHGRGARGEPAQGEGDGGRQIRDERSVRDEVDGGR